MPCTPQMKHCRQSCLHRQLVDDYHAARQAWWEAAEAATALYPAELAEYKRLHPQVTFKTWLIGQRRPAVPPAARQQSRSAA